MLLTFRILFHSPEENKCYCCLTAKRFPLPPSPAYTGTYSSCTAVTAPQLIASLPSLHRHFDKDKSGYLEHQEFKSCLRSLGYDLPIVEEGQADPEFEAILDVVDPNG